LIAQTDVEETIERIKGQKGVEGFFIVDNEGTLLRCKRLSKEYATELAADIGGCKTCRDDGCIS